MIEKRVEIIEKDGVNHERTSFIEVLEDGTEIVRGMADVPVQNEPVDYELTQNDRIEAGIDYLMATRD